MVKDHSESERENPLSPHGLLFPISSKGTLYASSHRQDSTYHRLCYTSRGALAGTRNRSMGFKKECYLIRQDNTIYKFSIKLSFSNIEQNKSKL